MCNLLITMNGQVRISRQTPNTRQACCPFAHVSMKSTNGTHRLIDVRVKSKEKKRNQKARSIPMFVCWLLLRQFLISLPSFHASIPFALAFCCTIYNTRDLVESIQVHSIPLRSIPLRSIPHFIRSSTFFSTVINRL